MIDLKLYEKNSDFQKTYLLSLKNRKEDPSSLTQALELNQSRRKLIQSIESLINKRKEIEKFFFSNNKDPQKLKQAHSIGDEISSLQNQLRETETQMRERLLRLPNICSKNVPAEKNMIIKTIDSPKKFSFPIKSHMELATKNIDIKRASKVTGSRFSFLRGSLAQLERALAHYMIDVHTKKNGYEELHTPFIVNKNSLIHTGQLPKFEEDLFCIKGQANYLLPTAEVSATNFFANEILMEQELPVKFVSYSPCFRAEAGAYGQDTKGLVRQHQFTKVELVIFSHPHKSYEELENLTSHAEMILSDLELPYRVVNLCAMDMSFSATQCHDLEVWLPSQKMYREISSCSNCEDYQSRRGKIRFRSSSGLQFVHTLNGSGLAVGRTLIALLENHQNEDGSVNIPKKLQPYMDGKKIILDKIK